MTELNCPYCKRRRNFIGKEQNKYECESCNNVYRQCKVGNCSNLVNRGFICKECIGKVIKNGGSAGLSVLAVAGGIALKVLRKGK
ncbi:hypothetical protein [Cytobacillus kochii]|uniref:hypothetical protein n=1 Tax=Cytobacillus kochii TaxID=859143 RepID=UPI00203CEEBA|nr:hypothetical protein [Cytobacillus kochii]MCM3322263.1 hypothetical protein [Cytobacillus kochii]MCM3345258.1 hypothetical protein [Cytobacillus kochii]